MAELITKGTTPTSVGHAFVPEGINFVKVESISEDGRFIEAKLAHITRECHEALGRSRLKSGDILFSIAGALGRTALVTSDVLPANTNQALAIIRLSKSNDVVSAYVLAALQADFTLEQIERLRGGVAQQNLSLAQLRELPIPLPSPAVQQSIVRHLGATRVETRRLESVYQRKLTALNELKKSLLHQAFSGQLRST